MRYFVTLQIANPVAGAGCGARYGTLLSRHMLGFEQAGAIRLYIATYLVYVVAVLCALTSKAYQTRTEPSTSSVPSGLFVVGPA